MIWPVLVGLLGLFIGSFLNVCIHRIPRGESIVFPGSRCPTCATAIKPWDNIPVLSYIILKRRCRYCGERISPRYPLVELASACLAVSLLYRFGLSVTFVLYYMLACALLVITFIDLDHQIIPDRISLGGIIVGLIAVPWLPLSYKDALIGLALGAGLLITIIYGYYILTGKQGMGGGDVKLLGMIGIFIGWRGVVFTIFVSSLIGAIVGIAWIYFQKKDMKTAIPFGPFLSLATIIYLFWGPAMITWYLMFMRP